MNKTWMKVVLMAGLSSAALARAEKSASTSAVATSTASTVPAEIPAAPAEPAAAASGVSVEKIAVGTGVESHEIQGEAAEFPAGTEKVYCLSRIVAPATPTTVKHVWSKDGVKMGEVVLNIKFSPFTTYSYHFTQPGAWKVEVQDEAGQTVSSADFTVK